MAFQHLFVIIDPTQEEQPALMRVLEKGTIRLVENYAHSDHAGAKRFLAHSFTFVCFLGSGPQGRRRIAGSSTDVERPPEMLS